MGLVSKYILIGLLLNSYTLQLSTLKVDVTMMIHHFD